MENTFDLHSLYYLLPTLFLSYQFLTAAFQFRKNLRTAKASGIPYIIAPWAGFDRRFLATEPLWFPILSRLPTFLTQPWLNMTRGDWSWYYRHSPFRVLGTDTVLMVSPRQNMMYTCDADVINQITMRRNDFPKPIEIYGILDLYGKNVVTVEGAEWRRHRKIAGAQFNEKSNAVVWRESLFQAGEMVRCWKDGTAAGGKAVPEGGKGDAVSVIQEIGRDTMKLSLHVISRAGFGVRCLWPSAGGKTEEKAQEGTMSSQNIPSGHVMSYVASLEMLLHRVILVLILPLWALKYSPWQLMRQTEVAFVEWGKYMSDIYKRSVKSAENATTESEGGLDLMGAMVRTSGVVPSTSKLKPGAGMTQSEIIGNSFVMFLAGHETAANSIHFATLFLALRPEIQRKLQAELDDIFGSAPSTSWDYDTYLPRLFSGWAGAIMNEQLRVVPPVINIPKSTAPNSAPQPLKVNGKDCVVGPGTYVNLNSIGAHRNPKYWPAGKPRSEAEGGNVHPCNTENDLDEFKPERWFVQARNGEKVVLTGEADADTGVDLSPDTAASMFKPPKGAYIPFSDGFRACLGRRFAQVEILAALAVLFKDHSVELCTDKWASEEEVRTMNEEARREVWHKERVEVERKLREEMGTVITIQLRGTPVRLRLCKRGQELFDI